MVLGWWASTFGWWFGPQGPMDQRLLEASARLSWSLASALPDLSRICSGPSGPCLSVCPLRYPTCSHVPCISSHLIVLHPCLWSHWFAATEDQNNMAAQEKAIRTTEVIFKYIAQTYLEMPTLNTTAAVPRPVTKSIMKAPSFLTSACFS